MTPYVPQGLEQIPLTEEVAWPGDPTVPLPDIGALGIDGSTYRYVGQGDIEDTSSQPDICIVASEDFVICSAFVMRGGETGVDTFSHVWPGVTDLRLERLLDRTNKTGKVHEAVFVHGGRSVGTGLEQDLARGRWQHITARAISVDTGSSWWAAVFDRPAGNLTVLRRQPVQSMLKFRLF